MRSVRVATVLLGILPAFFALFFSTPRLAAQTVTGRIVGTIRDQQGAVIPNTSISAKNVGTGAERTAVSDASGGFSIVSVPAGSYDVTASAGGFQREVRSGITLTVGAAARVDFSLTVGVVEQQVVVTGEAPQVDTTTSTMAGLVGDTTIRSLPLNGRDWLQLAILQPGVITVEEQIAGGNPTKSSGTKMSISGGRPSQNEYRVDGMVVNDQTNNSPGSALGVNLGVDAIREFSVLTNTFSAEYGRASGGVINAITMSGTNAIHGSAFEFLRNTALDARNFFDPARIPPFRRNQFGGSVGGPIKKDKLFYFANYEGLRQFLSESFSSNTLSPNARNGILASGPAVTIDPRIQPYLALFPLPNGAIVGDTGKVVFGAGQLGTEDYVTGRIDYLLSANTSLAGSYTFDNANLSTPDAFNEKLTASKSRNQRFMLSLQHVFSPTLLNTVRTGFNRVVAANGLDEAPNTPLLTDLSLGFVPGLNMGTFTIAGLSSPGGIGSSLTHAFWYTAPQVNDDLAWIKGRNNFRFGFSLEALRDNLNSLSRPAGLWSFGSVRNFLTDIPTEFDSDFPGTDSYRGVRTKIFGAYIQDDLRLRPNLTLNLGLRYEMGTTLSEVNGKSANLHNLADPQVVVGGPLYENPTKRDFAPRVGFAWDPFGSGKTAIRSGFGIFDIVPTPGLLDNRMERTVPFFESGVLLNPPPSSFPNSAFNLLGPTSLRTILVEFKPHPAYSMQWNLNVQQQITKDLSIAVGYVGSKAVHLPAIQGDADQVPPSLVTVAPDGHLLFPTNGPPQRINPNFSEIDPTQWLGFSIYHSLQVNVSQRLSHGISFQGVYVWSKNIDIGSAEFSSTENQNSMDSPWSFDPNLQRGVTDYDVPHHLSINFLWDVPSPNYRMAASRFLLAGWQLGGIFTAQSGTPFSVVAPVDRAGTGSAGATGSGGGQRPDLILGPGCGPNAVNAGNPDNYIKLQCFTFPKLGELGNLGRNTLRGPGLEDFDFSIFKNTNVLGEKLKAQFRAEFFNLLNRSNFGFGLVDVFNSNGQTLPVNAAVAPPTITKSRQMQFGLKFIW